MAETGPTARGAGATTKPTESFARKGEAITMTAIVTYAFDQIDQARTELNALSN
jgi:hypothetical protein